MKGVILAGGTGSRLAPLTKVTNKHLLPVYDRPMIFYSLEKLKESGVESILLISGRGHAGHFLDLLGSGKEFGVKISYEVQEKPGGIAHALKLAEPFVKNEKAFLVMLADNIFEDSLKGAIEDFEKKLESQAHIFLKEVKEPQHYGVPILEKDKQNSPLKIKKILEKPKNPPSSYAVTGCYLYRPEVFEIIKKLKPSARGELEISEVNDFYAQNGQLSFSILNGFWGDCGESFDSLLEAALFCQSQSRKANHKVVKSVDQNS